MMLLKTNLGYLFKIVIKNMQLLVLHSPHKIIIVKIYNSKDITNLDE